MAFAHLEDSTGTIPVVFFPRTYEESAELLRDDAVLLIKAKVDYRDEEMQLLAEKVSAPGELDLNHEASAVHHEIFIPRKTSKDKLQELGKLLKGNPGDDSVVVLIPNGSKPQRMVLPYGVAWSEKLEKEVGELLS